MNPPNKERFDFSRYVPELDKYAEVGFVQFSTYGNVVFLEFVSILPGFLDRSDPNNPIEIRYGRRGFGKEMMSAFETYIYENRPSINKLQLIVEYDNDGLKQFYTKCGFTLTTDDTVTMGHKILRSEGDTVTAPSSPRGGSSKHYVIYNRYRYRVRKVDKKNAIQVKGNIVFLRDIAGFIKRCK